MIAAIVAGFKALLVIVLIIAMSIWHVFHINGFERKSFWGELGATIIYIAFCLAVVKCLW